MNNEEPIEVVITLRVWVRPEAVREDWSITVGDYIGKTYSEMVEDDAVDAFEWDIEVDEGTIPKDISFCEDDGSYLYHEEASE